jgi:hypothetical protein
MAIDVEIEIKDSYIHLHCRGAFSTTSMLEVLDMALEVAEIESRNRVLIDLSELTGKPPTTLERLEIGVHAAQLRKQHGYNVHIAVFGKEPMVEATRFAETVAINRGATGRVFTDIAEAVDWLEKQ